jgi:hypothetical protein
MTLMLHKLLVDVDVAAAATTVNTLLPLTTKSTCSMVLLHQ